MENKKYILAFDTSNETIAIAVAKITGVTAKHVLGFCGQAHRESNTMLIPKINDLLKKANILPNQITLVLAGRGPGSFTGVRIALASAKGIATALNIGLVGFNTLDAIAWDCWNSGIFGHIYVCADAMRHEIYFALYESTKTGIKRLSSNKVLKAEKAAEEALDIAAKVDKLTVTGDALHKYFDMFEGLNIADQKLWTIGDNLQIDKIISDAKINLESLDEFRNNYNPATVLPVYTRLSDAEESEREKLADLSQKNLNSGVQNFINEHSSVIYCPMEITKINEIAQLENALMKSDAWNSRKLTSELNQGNKSWWTASFDNKVIAYGGAMQADNKMELLKIAVDKNFQNQGIAKKIISYIANDMRDLGAVETILEVRKSNESAQKFYEKIGLKKIANRKNYYSNGEDAIIMTGPLPILSEDVGGMNLQTNNNTNSKNTLKHPIIFSIESSCDETACAITCDGQVISDIVASQINFHKRFGGVVPEIASRKHIEAIVSVADECLDRSDFKWKDIDAIAVTYAPGLVGALVVGMAFAKGLAFALQKPLICVNHLEGHIYANKLSKADIKMPAIASVISGGNTMLIEVKDWGVYKTLGTTIDDAVGEAFDKLSKYLGLGYPGGPIISKLAKDGNPNAIKFPRAMIKEQNFDFSLSGLKTAVINYIDKHKSDKDFNLPDLCASFEQAIIDVQIDKAKKAILQTGAKSFLFGGGVAANHQLREAYKKMCEQENVEMVMASLSACGDNAAMISLVADQRYKAKKFSDFSIDVEAHASLDVQY